MDKNEQTKNKPYKCISEDNIWKIVSPNSTVKILDPVNGKETIKTKQNLYLVNPPFKTLFDGRYCAVSGYFFAFVDGKYSVLANKRGNGTPDYQGYWCCPCGYLERNEDSIDGIRRETLEECGISIPREKIQIIYVETEPSECNNGNVTIRHTAFLGKQEQSTVVFDRTFGGEVDEVADVRWIPVDEIDKYDWAFNHGKTLKKMIPNKWKLRYLKFITKNA